MNTKVEIWTSEAWVSTNYIKMISFDPPPGIVETQKDLDRGDRVDPQQLPKAMYLDRGKKSKLPDLFRVQGRLMVVSERLADLLREFELGRNQLIEIALFESDRVTSLPGRYFILNVAEHKQDCFVLEKSQGPIRGDGYLQPAPWGFEGIVVKSSAEAGVDLWMDPTLRRTPFFSGRLARAIKMGKFGRTGLKPCIVIP